MPALTNLPWRGAETIAAASAMITAHRDVELQLPASYHHAIVARLLGAPTNPTEDRLDVSGGAELLEALSHIQGLDALMQLEPVANRCGARVRVLSPSPLVILRADQGTTR